MNTIIAIVDDLFFASKIRGTAEQVGTRVQFSRSIPDAVAKARDEAPSLIIADLNAGCCDVFESRALGKVKMTPRVSALALDSFPTTKQASNQAAVEAAYDQVMPRWHFTKSGRFCQARCSSPTVRGGVGRFAHASLTEGYCTLQKRPECGGRLPDRQHFLNSCSY